MLHSLAEKIAVFLFDEKDKYPLEIYTYGMELLISSILETVILLILGILLNKFIETLIFIFAFSAIRFFTGGYHAKTYSGCAIVTVFVYLFTLSCYEILWKYLSDYLICIYTLVLLISLLLIVKFAPIENVGKSIENKQKIKRISVIVLITEFVLMFTGLSVDFHCFFVILPTLFSVDVLMLIEIIGKRGDKNEY